MLNFDSNCIHEEGGKVFCLIRDNHPINRAVFSIFRVDGLPPWKGSIHSGHEVFLLNDPVHLFKSIRNYLMTEKTGLMNLQFRGNVFTGKWQDIVELYNCDKPMLSKLGNFLTKQYILSSILCRKTKRFPNDRRPQ